MSKIRAFSCGLMTLYLKVVYLRQKEEVHVLVRVCLSVCLLEKYSKMRAWISMKCCVSTDVGTWTNLLTFEPDPDYNPDAGTGLLSAISYMRCYAEFYVGKIPARRYSEPWF